MYTRAIDAPPRWQWETWDSNPPNGPWNCNPSSTACILGFYKDSTPNINTLRRKAGVPDYQTMSTAAVVYALQANGVPAYKAQLTIAALTALVSSGRRPVLVGLWMARVPVEMRGHSFLGMHGVAARANQTRNGVPGKLVMDPNFNPSTGRVDKTGGLRWYSDAVISWAMHEPTDPARVSTSVVPSNPKVIPAGDVIAGHIVIIERAVTLTLYKVGAGCKLTPREQPFSHSSQAPVVRGTCGGRVYWQTTAGGLIGWSYVCGLTDVGYHIERLYRRTDGTTYSVRIPCTGS